MFTRESVIQAQQQLYRHSIHLSHQCDPLADIFVHASATAGDLAARLAPDDLVAKAHGYACRAVASPVAGPVLQGVERHPSL